MGVFFAKMRFLRQSVEKSRQFPKSQADKNNPQKPVWAAINQVSFPEWKGDLRIHH
jgi:hypothetical protein